MMYFFEEKPGFSDIQFTAEGKDVCECFTAAWEALVVTAVENANTLDPCQKRELRLEEEDLEFLLYDFLQEFVYLKDTEDSIFRIESIKIKKTAGGWRLRAGLYGEPFSAEKHGHGSDIKAVTFHEFFLKKDPDGLWRARVMLDI
jgi:SHS2 domain-containing protein